jgi:hypothetical protein
MICEARKWYVAQQTVSMPLCHYIIKQGAVATHQLGKHHVTECFLSGTHDATMEGLLGG